MEWHSFRKSFEEEAKQLVNEMTLEEKVMLMSGKTEEYGERYNVLPFPSGGNERLGIPPIRFADGPRGVVPGNSTCFPVPMARGASFDQDLERRIGEAIGKEIRAYDGNYFGGVCINLPYHPGWGRSQEVYGEDTYLLGTMGSQLVKGVQSEGVVACIKHYAFNSMEKARFKVNVKASKRTEKEVFLNHFHRCVRAGAGSVMTSYNQYNGEFCGESDYLLKKVLREEWGFDGFVISDFFWGFKSTVQGVKAGMDIEMPNTRLYGQALLDAVESGKVSVEEVNSSVLRIIRTMIAHEKVYQNHVHDESVISSEAHKALALEAAEKAITMIKNKDKVLPLPKRMKSIAVIGRLADRQNLGDRGSSRVHPEYVVTILDGIKKKYPDTNVIHESGDDMEHAMSIAEKADAVVFVVGYDHNDEGEYVSKNFANEEITAEELEKQGFAKGGDRVSLSLKEKEIELIKKISKVNQQSVVITIGGSTIMTREWEDDVSSILFAYYPGMEGGTAISNILSGDVSPSGKLPFVIPETEAHLPDVDWEAKEIEYDYYVGYTKLEKEGNQPAYPFGYGLTFSRFSFSDLTATANKEVIELSVTVTNKGNHHAEEIVQLYVGYDHSVVERPVKQLKDYKRVQLSPGESRAVTLTCHVNELKWYNEEKQRWELEEMDYQLFAGNSSASTDLLETTVSISDQ